MTDAIPEKPFWGLTPAADEVDLAARLLELEAENKRLREGLDLASHRLNAAAVFAGSHAPNREMYEFGEWFKEARDALKGGEI